MTRKSVVYALAVALLVATAAVAILLGQRKALSTRVQLARDTARDAVTAAATGDSRLLSGLYDQELSALQLAELRSLVTSPSLSAPAAYEAAWWNPAGSDDEGRDRSTVQVQSRADRGFAVSVEMTWRGWLDGWRVLSITDDRPPK